MERLFDPEIWREVTGGAIADRVRRLTRVTPLVPAPALGRRTGADVWLKLENLQRTGSFKLRGAAARLAAVARDAEGQRPPRVIAASAGNHGLGVALAAQAFGIDATVLGFGADARGQTSPASPRWAPPSRWWARPTTRPRPRRDVGPAPILPCNLSPRSTTTTSSRATGACWPARYWRSCPTSSLVVVPVGGGGLAGGIGVEVVPRGIRMLGVSPEVNCAMRRSLDEDRAYTTYQGGPTLAEGLEGAVSERTFGMARDYFPEIALVSEIAIRQAIVYAYRSLGILCEASAAPALAALLEDPSAIRGRRVVVVISGGNIEPDLLDQLLAGTVTSS